MRTLWLRFVYWSGFLMDRRDGNDRRGTAPVEAFFRFWKSYDRNQNRRRVHYRRHVDKQRAINDILQQRQPWQ